ncbi:MAG: hypothetical protein NZM11_08655, partial [Anaerolineales bacterium]|nr:hypothetical protein [Anaerolineales bacterium]
LKMQLFVQADGNVRIQYDITFTNSEFADPIDIVDIGMPHSGYDRRNMTASLDGNPLSDIRDSEFVTPGVEVHLDEFAIQPGATGTLRFEFTMPRLLYEDVTRPGYVSLQITPTWFGEQFVQGTTNLQIAIHMLPGIHPDEVLWQDRPFTDKALFNDRAVVVWQVPQHRLTGPYRVAASFPNRGITAGIVRQNVLDLAVKWMEDNPEAGILIGALVVGLFAVAFFRFSGGTGISVFVLLAGGLIFLMAASGYATLCLAPGMVGAVIANEYFLHRRKREYRPAIAQVEGGGIKRGLTAPEAAALLELPLSRVLGLVLFGLLKKGVLVQVKDTPLTVRLADEYRAPDKNKRTQYRLAVAQKKGIVLHEYEHAFLDVIEGAPLLAVVEKLDFGKAMRRLLDGVAARMKGFDLSDTQDYYRRIVSRVVAEAQSLGDVKMREQAIDRNLEWILMDRNFPTVLDAPGMPYRPIWKRPIVTGGGTGTGMAKPSLGAPGPAAGGKSSVGDVAAGFAGWAENTMGNLASAILPGSMGVPSKGGFVNLSGADKVTGDIFKALAESSSTSGGGRSGGGGRSCACACAGCACACACAGGGR